MSKVTAKNECFIWEGVGKPPGWKYDQKQRLFWTRDLKLVEDYISHFDDAALNLYDKRVKVFIKKEGNTYFASRVWDGTIFRNSGWEQIGKDLWRTENARKAKLVNDYMPLDLQKINEHDFENREKQEKENVEKSKNATPAFNIPAPQDLAFYPHQSAAIIASRGRKNLLIADEVGLGKTVTALGIVSDKQIERPVLIICPNILLLHWQKEAAKWLPKKNILSNVADFPLLKDGDVFVLSYNEAVKHQETIKEKKWGCLVVDDSHHLRDPDTKRTQAILGGKDSKPIQATNKIFISATPFVSHPKDVWTTLYALNACRDYDHFHEDYCGMERTRYGMQDVDFSDPDKLARIEKLLRSTVMIRRTWDDIDSKSLSLKRRSIIPIPSTLELLELAKQNRLELQKVEYKDADTFFGDKPEFRSLSETHKLIGVEKVDVVANLANESTCKSRKTVIFACHKDVADGITARLGKYCQQIDSTMTLEQRIAACEEFSKNDKFFAVVAQPIAKGLDLTCASRVIFAETSWHQSQIQEAENVCHPISKTAPTTFLHVVLEGTLDCELLARSVANDKNAKLAIDGIGKKSYQNDLDVIVSTAREKAELDARTVARIQPAKIKRV